MSNDGTLLVNFSALQTASGDISRAISALHTQLADLDRDAQPLVESWDGEAKRAYHERHAQWRRASEDLTNVLQHIKAALDHSAQDYLQTEQRNARQFGG
jgi:WXG100 family type VII secretion target